MNTFRRLEHAIIDVVSAVTPWLTPVVPAYLVYVAGVTHLQLPALVAFTMALAVEGIGLASVHTAVTFWTYNDERRKSEDPAPVLWAVVAGVFYVAIVLTTNALLEVWIDPLAHTVAKALLSLLSVDAALIIALRAQHSRRLSEADAERQERRIARQKADTPVKIAQEQPATLPNAPSPSSVSLPAPQKNALQADFEHLVSSGVGRDDAIRKLKANNPAASGVQIAQAAGVSPATVSRVLRAD